MAAKEMSVTVDVLNVPELIWMARQAMAEILLEHAKTEEDPRVAERLTEIAGVFIDVS